MKLFKRENYLSKIRGFYHTNDIIKVITGIRRCGKSSLMQMIADEIIESGVNKENIIYINLDKKGFKSIKKADELENLIDSLSNVKGNKYLFIDEIQNVENFEDVINAYREEDEYSIFITGSNSYLLSGELITKLTGRYIEFEMFPLTFEEYLGMKEFYKYDINSNLLIELNNYIIEGGFPRTMFFDDLNDKRTYVKGIVEEIFKKDIKSRCVIRKKETFDLVMNYIINNFGCTTSINNILENLNKSGLGISKTKIIRNIKCLIDAKILYECDRFDMKSKRSLLGEKKYYIADLSFSYISNPDSRINYGPVLENVIYTYARSKSYTVTVGRIGKLECDFILKDKELNYSYRNSFLKENKDYICIETTLELTYEDSTKIKEIMDSRRQRRIDTQPLDMPSAGSVFRNPEELSAGKLIEDIGLKGYTIGGAMISPKHANFIVNTGEATYEDIIELIEEIKRKVKEEYNINLILEQEIIG